MLSIKREDEKELRRIVSEELERIISAIVDKRLTEWYEGNIERQVSEAIKAQFRKISIVKFE